MKPAAFVFRFHDREHMQKIMGKLGYQEDKASIAAGKTDGTMNFVEVQTRFPFPPPRMN